jgi:hypothetical protein
MAPRFMPPDTSNCVAGCGRIVAASYLPGAVVSEGLPRLLGILTSIGATPSLHEPTADARSFRIVARDALVTKHWIEFDNQSVYSELNDKS